MSNHNIRNAADLTDAFRTNHFAVNVYTTDIKYDEYPFDKYPFEFICNVFKMNAFQRFQNAVCLIYQKIVWYKELLNNYSFEIVVGMFREFLEKFLHDSNIEWFFLYDANSHHYGVEISTCASETNIRYVWYFEITCTGDEYLVIETFEHSSTGFHRTTSTDKVTMQRYSLDWDPIDPINNINTDK